MQRDEFFWLRVIGCATAVALAAAILVADGIGTAFLLLVGIAAFVVAFPWQRLTTLRAGPFEMSLELGQIKAVVDAIEIEGEAKERLMALLARLKGDIELARGGRVLWVDDKPRRVVAERRLLRALQIETVTVPFSRDAAETLRRDNDFDLVITSLYKGKERRETGQPTDGRRPGVLFVQWLRGGTDEDPVICEIYEGAIADKVVNNLPVIFYVAGVEMEKLKQAIRPVAEMEPGVELAQRMEEFLAKAIRLVADARADPISVPAEKALF